MSTSFERRVDARFVLSVIACGIMSFSGVVVETAMNITFPTLMAEFGVDTATVQRITTGFLLVLAAIMPLSALLKRRFRTKQLFMAAFVLFQAIVLGLGYLIPYYAQVVGGLNGFSAGCLLLPDCTLGVFAGKAKGEC